MYFIIQQLSLQCAKYRLKPPTQERLPGMRSQQDPHSEYGHRGVQQGDAKGVA